MNAVNPVQTSPVSSQGGTEPSMEEILASIRKIIADDGAPTRLTDARHDREPEPVAVAHPEDRPSRHEVPHADFPGTPEPAENSTEEHLSVPHFTSLEDSVDESVADLPPHPLAPPPEVAGLGAIEHTPRLRDTVHGAEPRAVGDAPERLLSAAADSSVAAAFNTLAASRFVDNSEHFTGLVREMIRPLVKSWIDENLPGLVERLVVAEIERMARG